MVWGSLACPRISSNAGSDTKKKRGNASLFFSKYLDNADRNTNLFHIHVSKMHCRITHLFCFKIFTKVPFMNCNGLLNQYKSFSHYVQEFSNLWKSVFSHPVSDFWHSSSCSIRWGRSCIKVSSPTQHWTTLGVSCARVMIFTQDLSILLNRLASCLEKEECFNHWKVEIKEHNFVKRQK